MIKAQELGSGQNACFRNVNVRVIKPAQDITPQHVGDLLAEDPEFTAAALAAMIGNFNWRGAHGLKSGKTFLSAVALRLGEDSDLLEDLVSPSETDKAEWWVRPAEALAKQIVPDELTQEITDFPKGIDPKMVLGGIKKCAASRRLILEALDLDENNDISLRFEKNAIISREVGFEIKNFMSDAFILEVKPRP